MRVVVNAAISADGKLSSRKREQIEISGPTDFRRVDALRAASDAVMVGVETVIADDPSLTIKSEQLRNVRAKRGDPPHPARVVADSRVRTPPDSTLLDGQAATYLLVSDTAPPNFVDRMEEMGTTVISAGETRVDLADALDELATHGVDQLLVEGGGEIIYSLFEAELVDRLSVYVGSMIIGGREAPTLVDGAGFTGAFPRLELETVNRVDDGVCLEYTVQ